QPDGLRRAGDGRAAGFRAEGEVGRQLASFAGSNVVSEEFGVGRGRLAPVEADERAVAGPPPSPDAAVFPADDGALTRLDVVHAEDAVHAVAQGDLGGRSEERRVGKESRGRGAPGL